MITLGHELKRRGHNVTLFGVLDAQPKTVAAGLSFEVFGESEYPTGTILRSLKRLGELSGYAALQYTVNEVKRGAAVLLRDAPGAIRKAGVEALLIDQGSPEGATVAEFLYIPFISVCNALMLNQEEGVPPPFTPWKYNSAWWAQLRNRVGYSLIERIGQPLRQVIDEYRQQWNLPIYSSFDDSCSQLAQISQQPTEFEFPRKSLPQCFHFTGPYHNSTSRETISFPFEKLTGQPLLYASMGTVQNRLIGIFHSIAEACVGLDIQLVISLGGSDNLESLQKLPGEPLVVKYAPQLELLQKASLAITHAGMNTVLESLSNGVPMVAIPIANDQPGVAARIAWTGTGEVVPLARLSVFKLRSAIHRVLTEDFYKENALRLQEAIHEAGGVKRSADIIEQVVLTGKPVYR